MDGVEVDQSVNRLKKIPNSPDGLVQLYRRNDDPTRLYYDIFPKDRIEINSSRCCWGSRVLRYDPKGTKKEARKLIYELAKEVPMGDVGKFTNGPTTSLEECSVLINAFIMGPVEDDNSCSIVFKHIPIGSYKLACDPNNLPRRLESELLDLFR